MVEIWETHGTHSTTTHHFHHLHLHSTSIIHLHSHSPPFCHFTIERSTDRADHLLKDEAKNHQEKEEATWPLCGAGRSASYFPHYKSQPQTCCSRPSHNTILALEFKNLEEKIVVEFPLVEVVLEKERVRGNLGECSVKILRKRGRGAAEI